MLHGAVWFALVFILLPLALLAGAMVAPSYALALGLFALVLVGTGFTVGVGAMRDQ